MPGVSFYTLGCKLNQLETEAAAEAFAGAGFEPLPWSERRNAALLVINTCTVTSKAEQKARRIIRLALKETTVPLVVTGCYAELEAERLAALDRRVFVLPGKVKDRLLDLPALFAVHGEQSLVHLGKKKNEDISGAFRFRPRRFSFHSRTFLKIQDGCDRNCAYCRVPLARGKSRSLDAFEVLKRLKTLEADGAAETVLTGVNIAQYLCPESGKKLGELLCFLLDNTTSVALRLSSIEPEPSLLSPVFLQAVSSGRIRPHFHLSVQSGSAAVLRAMGRPYGPREVYESAALLRGAKGDPFLACDMIAGFPGETDEDFEESCGLARGVGFAWIHGFPYSPRPGTPAWKLNKRICERETAARLDQLLELARRGKRAYIERWTGRIVAAVAEQPGLSWTGVLSANYLRLRVSPGPAQGSALRCRITAERPGGFDAGGEIVE